jgi:hypothetical protein
MKRILTITIAILVLTLAFGTRPILADKPTGFDENGQTLGAMGEGGFDEYGYNDTARIFSGTGSSWCLAKGQPADCMGINSPDKLVMKWNAEWDRGNAENWSNPPYAAWENNEWNGMVEGGSGTVWHYKIVWVGPCGADSTPLDNGGYCIWGQFETIMDQGVDPNSDPIHTWVAHANPAGYGAYVNP